MKIIKRGTPSDSAQWYLKVEWTCPRCHTVFQPEHVSEVTTVRRNQLTGAFEALTYCPECLSQTGVVQD